MNGNQHEVLTFDAHCHIFNIKYAIREVWKIIAEILSGDYPIDKPEKNAIGLLPTESMEKAGIIRFVKWLRELTDACIESEQDNAKSLKDLMRKHFPVKPQKPAIIPLMMDIYYMFAYRLGPYEAVSKSKNCIQPKSHLSVSGSAQSVIRQLFGTPLKSANTKMDGIIQDLLKNELEAIVSDPDMNNASMISKDQTEKMKWTPGFKKHYKALKSLSEENKEVYPFFAVDPRRPGVLSEIERSVGRKGPFYGVKLYPRLGYHPMCKALDRVFEFCASNNIPIVTHCGSRGFPPWKTDVDDYGNPNNFSERLQKYPELKINFAHFGSAEKMSKQWKEAIIQLMLEYDGVYIDLSCFTEEDEFAKFKKGYWNKPKIRNRTMFGTDYDIMYLTNVFQIDMEQYCKMLVKDSHNREVFIPDEIKTISQTVPAEFLDLK